MTRSKKVIRDGEDSEVSRYAKRYPLGQAGSRYPFRETSPSLTFKIINFQQKELAEAAIREASKNIDYNTVDYSLECLIDKIMPQEIVDDLRWDELKQSYFIESLMLGFPALNIVFINNRWNAVDEYIELIDGRQRLYTAINFVKGNLVLANLKTLTSLNGFKFGDLVLSRQKKFKMIFEYSDTLCFAQQVLRSKTMGQVAPCKSQIRSKSFHKVLNLRSYFMEKLKILDILSIIKDEGYCNMFDRNCIIQILKSASENKIADYLESLSSQEYVSLLSKDLSDYIKG